MFRSAPSGTHYLKFGICQLLVDVEVVVAYVTNFVITTHIFVIAVSHHH